MNVYTTEKISISGKSSNQRVVFHIKGMARLYMQESDKTPGEWFTRFGDAHTRYEMKKWLVQEFGTENPPFDLIFERAKAINPPKPINTKAMPWLR